MGRAVDSRNLIQLTSIWSENSKAHSDKAVAYVFLVSAASVNQWAYMCLACLGHWWHSTLHECSVWSRIWIRVICDHGRLAKEMQCGFHVAAMISLVLFSAGSPTLWWVALLAQQRWCVSAIPQQKDSHVSGCRFSITRTVLLCF